MKKVILLASMFMLWSPFANADYWWDISMNDFPRLEVSGDNQLWFIVGWGQPGKSISSHTGGVNTGVTQVKLTAASPDIFKLWLSLILAARNTGETITVYAPQPGNGENVLSATRLVIQKN